MIQRFLVGLCLASFVAVGAPAYAADVTTVTHTEQNLVETFVDKLPSCERHAPLYNITTTSNAVEHITKFGDGRKHVTFTEAGTFVASPKDDSSLPNYTGHFTIWGGFNVNGDEVNGTFTFSINGTGSDGSTLRHQSVQHFDATPNGTVHQFFRCH